MARQRVALLSRYPEKDEASPRLDLPNFGVRRVQAILRADPRLDDVELTVFEFNDEDPETIADQVHAWDPDIIGVSCYLWSLPVLHPALRELKQKRADRITVYGGPSAHPNSLVHAPFDDAPSVVSALAPGEAGAWALAELVHLAERGRPDLEAVAGLQLCGPDGWRSTRAPRPLPALDATPSPFQEGLIESGNAAMLQTYRGCPFSCTYCSWGKLRDPSDTLSVDHLVRELSAYERQGLVGALQVDAALNLNDQAFSNLATAEGQVGFFRHGALIMEAYPQHLKEEHFAFIDGVAEPQVSVGLQSYDPEVLQRLERPFDVAEFERSVRLLSEVAHPNIEIMVGLPGDTPATFRRTFERARQLPSNLRVYHCLVLPDALAARAPEAFDLKWDPVNLKVQSCWGWSERDLAETLEFLTQTAEQEGSSVGEYWWSFDQVGRSRLSGPTLPRHPLDTTLCERAREAVAGLAHRQWSFQDSRAEPGRVRFWFRSGERPLLVEALLNAPGVPCYRALGGIAFRYDSSVGGHLLAVDEESFLDLITTLQPIAAEALEYIVRAADAARAAADGQRSRPK